MRRQIVGLLKDLLALFRKDEIHKQHAGARMGRFFRGEGDGLNRRCHRFHRNPVDGSSLAGADVSATGLFR